MLMGIETNLNKILMVLFVPAWGIHELMHFIPAKIFNFHPELILNDNPSIKLYFHDEEFDKPKLFFIKRFLIGFLPTIFVLLIACCSFFFNDWIFIYGNDFFTKIIFMYFIICLSASSIPSEKDMKMVFHPVEEAIEEDG